MYNFFLRTVIYQAVSSTAGLYVRLNESSPRVSERRFIAASSSSALSPCSVSAPPSAPSLRTCDAAMSFIVSDDRKCVCWPLRNE